MTTMFVDSNRYREYVTMSEVVYYAYRLRAFCYCFAVERISRALKPYVD